MRKIFKVLFSLLIISFATTIFSGCSDEFILVVGVDFYQERVYGAVGDEIELSCKVYPSNASNKKVVYASTDNSIASVDENGKVSIKSDGNVMISVTTVDGSFVDYCEIVTYSYPDEIRWDTDSESNGRTIFETDPSFGYTGKTTVALDQEAKLGVKYFVDGVEADITATNIVFTSKMPECVKVINSSQGIIKVIDNSVDFVDVVASMEVPGKETLSITCRVEINEYTGLDKFQMKTVFGEKDVLVTRDGADIVYLDADDAKNGIGTEYFVRLYNLSGVVMEDYDLELTSSNEDIFVVKNLSIDEEDHIYYFTLLPKKEGTATLFLETTAFSDQGKQIRASVNVVVQASIGKVEATASERYEVTNDGDEIEIVLRDQIFAINLNYFAENEDGSFEKINAKRELFINLKNFESSELSDYLVYYGGNNFKVKAVPFDTHKKFEITGWVYKENNVIGDGTDDIVTFTYTFFIRNELKSLIVSEREKDEYTYTDEDNNEKDGLTLPTSGITELAIFEGDVVDLFAYALGNYSTAFEPTRVTCSVVQGTSVSIEDKGLGMRVFERRLKIAIGPDPVIVILDDVLSRNQEVFKKYLTDNSITTIVFDEKDQVFKAVNAGPDITGLEIVDEENKVKYKYSIEVFDPASIEGGGTQGNENSYTEEELERINEDYGHFVITTHEQGDTTVKFVATDGVLTIEVDVVVHVIPKVV